VRAETVDGNDPEAVFEAVFEARARALAGEGPTLITARSMRMHGHGAHDDARYVAPELLAEWAVRDPIEGYAARLGLDDGELTALSDGIDEQIERAVQAALETPMPDPITARAGVFCEGDGEPLGVGGDAPFSGYRAP
jgi:pyruvate dehydrogenase E1 component alpha subunit